MNNINNNTYTLKDGTTITTDAPLRKGTKVFVLGEPIPDGLYIVDSGPDLIYITVIENKIDKTKRVEKTDTKTIDKIQKEQRFEIVYRFLKENKRK
ncbi:MAG: hypothetical protein NTW16_00200 [Bacteroidetes bacterium]|nr:hypothetical protein [Bacteroidota bacterium]